MTVIDVHTHMLTLEFLDLMRERSGGKYEIKKTKAGQDTIYHDGAPFMTLFSGMWDYEERIEAMNAARVDVAIVSLTSPNVYWGDRATSLKAAQLVNDSMAGQQPRGPSASAGSARCHGSSQTMPGRSSRAAWPKAPSASWCWPTSTGAI